LICTINIFEANLKIGRLFSKTEERESFHSSAEPLKTVFCSRQSLRLGTKAVPWPPGRNVSQILINRSGSSCGVAQRADSLQSIRPAPAQSHNGESELRRALFRAVVVRHSARIPQQPGDRSARRRHARRRAVSDHQRQSVRRQSDQRLQPQLLRSRNEAATRWRSRKIRST